MNPFVGRAEKVIFAANTLLTDHLLLRISLAITICRMTKHHLGNERDEEFKIARKIYYEVDQFCIQHEVVLNQELTGAINRLHLELQAFNTGAEPQLA